MEEGSFKSQTFSVANSLILIILKTPKPRYRREITKNPIWLPQKVGNVLKRPFPSVRNKCRTILCKRDESRLLIFFPYNLGALLGAQ
jgi:hypothetical protein